jgi:hypothetical protein
MDKTEHAAIMLFSAGLIFALASSAPAQTTNADFQQAVTAYQQSHSYADIENVIKLAAAMSQPPPIPEEARRHFVMGQTMFKDAKSQADYAQAADEFLQATRLAPWWPEARNNTAAMFEAAGDYANALANLKIYQMFKLPDPEARAIQDKIYALEAKQKMAANDAQVAAQKKAEADRQQEAERQKAAEAAEQSKELERKRTDFSGEWVNGNGSLTLTIQKNSDGMYFGSTSDGHPLEDITCRGNTMTYVTISGSLQGSGPHAQPKTWRHQLTINEDGRSALHIVNEGQLPTITLYRK